ncbi:MAG: hypothetical protein IMX00_10245 [Limnochordales bacterium]|nr:hypothetical protein [Limnochordales bacterium]
MKERCVLAIDPGRTKVGVAVVAADGRVFWRGIVTPPELPAVVTSQWEKYQPEAVVVGDRTGSREMVELLRRECPKEAESRIILVPEHGSTLAARSRYWREKPPRGWRRLLPQGLLNPAEPVDDLVAVILAERYWAGR